MNTLDFTTFETTMSKRPAPGSDITTADFLDIDGEHVRMKGDRFLCNARGRDKSLCECPATSFLPNLCGRHCTKDPTLTAAPDRVQPTPEKMRQLQCQRAAATSASTANGGGPARPATLVSVMATVNPTPNSSATDTNSSSTLPTAQAISLAGTGGVATASTPVAGASIDAAPGKTSTKGTSSTAATTNLSAAQGPAPAPSAIGGFSAAAFEAVTRSFDANRQADNLSRDRGSSVVPHSEKLNLALETTFNNTRARSAFPFPSTMVFEKAAFWGPADPVWDTIWGLVSNATVPVGPFTGVAASAYPFNAAVTSQPIRLPVTAAVRPSPPPRGHSSVARLQDLLQGSFGSTSTPAWATVLGLVKQDMANIAEVSRIPSANMLRGATTVLREAIVTHLATTWKTVLASNPDVSPLPYPLQTCLLGEVGNSARQVVRACTALGLHLPAWARGNADSEPESRAQLEAALQGAGFHSLRTPPAGMDEATLFAALSAAASPTLPGGAQNDIGLADRHGQHSRVTSVPNTAGGAAAAAAGAGSGAGAQPHAGFGNHFGHSQEARPSDGPPTGAQRQTYLRLLQESAAADAAMQDESSEEPRINSLRSIAEAASSSLRTLAQSRVMLTNSDTDVILDHYQNKALDGVQRLRDAGNQLFGLPDSIVRGVINANQSLIRPDGSTRPDAGMRNIMSTMLDHKCMLMSMYPLTEAQKASVVEFKFMNIPAGIFMRRSCRETKADMFNNIVPAPSKSMPAAHLVKVVNGAQLQEYFERLFELAGEVHGSRPMRAALDWWRRLVADWRELFMLVVEVQHIFSSHCNEFASSLQQWASGIDGASAPKPSFVAFGRHTQRLRVRLEGRTASRDDEDPMWTSFGAPATRAHPQPGPHTRAGGGTATPARLPPAAAAARLPPAAPAGQGSGFVDTHILPRLNCAVPAHAPARRAKIMEVAARAPTPNGARHRICFNLVENKTCPNSPNCADRNGITMVCYHNIDTI